MAAKDERSARASSRGGLDRSVALHRGPTQAPETRPPRPDERPTTAQSITIKVRGGQSGGCAVKAAGLPSGGLRRVRKTRTERFRSPAPVRHFPDGVDLLPLLLAVVKHMGIHCPSVDAQVTDDHGLEQQAEAHRTGGQTCRGDRCAGARRPSPPGDEPRTGHSGHFALSVSHAAVTGSSVWARGTTLEVELGDETAPGTVTGTVADLSSQRPLPQCRLRRYAGARTPADCGGTPGGRCWSFGARSRTTASG